MNGSLCLSHSLVFDHLDGDATRVIALSLTQRVKPTTDAAPVLILKCLHLDDIKAASIVRRIAPYAKDCLSRHGSSQPPIVVLWRAASHCHAGDGICDCDCSLGHFGM